MKYFKQYREPDAKKFEVTKEEAKTTLEGHWAEDALKDIFENDRMFRLYTPWAEVWTQDNKGMLPMAGFYGIVG